MAGGKGPLLHRFLVLRNLSEKFIVKKFYSKTQNFGEEAPILEK